jgi:dihydroorotate dehydrogenase (NAD+) catalytic subunit
MTASGCAAAGRELDQFFDVSELGAIVTEVDHARPAVRAAHSPHGGDAVGDAELDRPAGSGHRLVPRQGPAVAGGSRRPPDRVDRGGTTEEFVELARRVATSPGVAALEVNISCPNVENRGLSSPATGVRHPGRRSRAGGGPAGLPLLAKLTPDVTDIVSVATSVVDAGADALV